MAKHEDLYPLILVEAPGCPIPLVQHAINRAAIEFCRLSLAWQEDLDAIGLRAGVWRYDLDVPTQSQLVVLQSVCIGTRDLVGVADPRGAMKWGVSKGEPSHYALLPNFIEIAVDPTPVAVATLTLSAALAPTLAATTLPDLLVDRHFEAISEGAKAVLKRMPNQAWSDPASAQMHAALAAKAAHDARASNEYGRVVGSLSVTSRRFGG